VALLWPPCLLPPLAHSDSQLLLSENQEAACPTYTQPRIGSGRAGEETAGVGRAQGREEGGRRARWERTEGVRLRCDRPSAVSVSVEAAEGGVRWAGFETLLLLLFLLLLLLLLRASLRIGG